MATRAGKINRELKTKDDVYALFEIWYESGGKVSSIQNALEVSRITATYISIVFKSFIFNSPVDSKNKIVVTIHEKFSRLGFNPQIMFKRNPRVDYNKIPAKYRKVIGLKIRKLMHEGFSQKQAIAISLQMAKKHLIGPRGGKKKNPGRFLTIMGYIFGALGIDPQKDIIGSKKSPDGTIYYLIRKNKPSKKKIIIVKKHIKKYYKRPMRIQFLVVKPYGYGIVMSFDDVRKNPFNQSLLKDIAPEKLAELITLANPDIPEKLSINIAKAIIENVDQGLPANIKEEIQKFKESQ